MSEYTKHHFVPQFCLREFAIDAKGRRIGTYLIERGLYVASASIRSQAQRAKLYGSDEREKHLSLIESAAANVLHRMVSGFEVPRRFTEDHSTLLVHVIFQAMRTPATASILEEQANQMMKVLMSHEKTVAPYVDKVRLKLRDGAALMLQGAEKSIALALDLRYKLLRNRTGIPLVISDQPVCRYNQFAERRKMPLGGTGCASRGLQMFLPLCPTLTLMMYDGDVYRVGRASEDSVVDLNAADVDALNMLQFVNAGSQLFFGAGVTKEMVEDLSRRSQAWIGKPRTTVTEFPQAPPAAGKHRSLLITSLQDIRIKLSLASVAEQPSAQKVKMINGASFLRDPELCDSCHDFDERVTAGLYNRAEFGRYLDDVAGRCVRQFFEAT